jgi:hypothetical protein
MTELLKEAVDCLENLPEDLQDKIARALIIQLNEDPEPEADHS